MAFRKPRTQEWQARHAFGPAHTPVNMKNVLKVQEGYTILDKKVLAADADYVLAATTASASVTTTVTSGLTDPDVPRNLTVTSGGTAGDIKATNVTVTGTNVMGETITEDFLLTVDTATTVTGAKAFRTVTSVAIPAQDGAGATITVGVGDKLGLEHMVRSNSVIKIAYYDGSAVTLEDAAASALSTSAIESNTVTPTTVADGTNRYYILYFTYNWSVGDTNDNPSY